MPRVKCSECGSQGTCFCQNLGAFSSYVLSYQYTFFCSHCGRKEVRVDKITYEIWSTFNYFSTCPFCGKICKKHSRPV